jgi:hypothetical protein
LFTIQDVAIKLKLTASSQANDYFCYGDSKGAKEKMMFNYPQYFKEWDVPQAGISAISMYIHPNLIKKHSLFHEKGNVNEAINFRKIKIKKRFSEDTVWTNYVIDIQTEALNPNANILSQVFGYITLAFQSKILSFRNYPDESLVMDFLKQSFHTLFIIDFIDFYFDIREDDAILLGKKNHSFPDAQYCDGFHIKTYDRINQLKNRRNIDSQLVSQMQFPRRIEFHLSRRTCEHLHYVNLDGDFNTVFFNYLHSLSQKWYEYKGSLIDIPNIQESDYYYLKQIDSLAFSPTLSHSRALEKTPRKPMPNNKARAGENKADFNWCP